MLVPPIAPLLVDRHDAVLVRVGNNAPGAEDAVGGVGFALADGADASAPLPSAAPFREFMRRGEGCNSLTELVPARKRVGEVPLGEVAADGGSRIGGGGTSGGSCATFPFGQGGRRGELRRNARRVSIGTDKKWRNGDVPC